MRAVLAGALLLAAAATAPAGVEWQKDFDTAIAAGKAQGKLVQVHFWADW